MKIKVKTPKPVLVTVGILNNIVPEKIDFTLENGKISDCSYTSLAWTFEMVDCFPIENDWVSISKKLDFVFDTNRKTHITFHFGLSQYVKLSFFDNEVFEIVHSTKMNFERLQGDVLLDWITIKF